MVKIEFSGETPLEALASLVAYSRYCTCNAVVQKAAEERMDRAERRMAQGRPSDSEGPVGESPAREQEDGESRDGSAPREPKPEPEPTAEEEKEEAAPSSDPGEDDAHPAYTLSQVREIGTDAGKKYGVAPLRAILQEFKASSIGALAPEQFPAFVAAVESLGEKDA